ncbi:DNA polymerase Y family protein [Zavarzinella formosa]|uniref:DNA polymerase Y family protein n=1 Tax=Zavarzinella formosa TaxID=360055 RepID=UPI000306F336|nr:hypothetical protein [Zavarzinella formosa]
MSVKYLFVDMNSFFASVEQQEHPEYRNKPVAVVPLDTDTTCCIAVSHEAKKFGIKTGTRVGDAKQMCRGIIIIPASPKIYIEKHHEIHKAVESILPVTAVLSVDEMVCRLWGDHATVERATEVAKAVKRAIIRDAGECMTCSVGIAPNRLLAKVAADMKKPDGLTVIRREELPERLHVLELNDFPGIGHRMERRLNNSGVTSTKQLTSLSEGDLSRIWGSRLLGGSWFQRLRGADVPESPTRRRSIGHSRVLEPSFRNPKDAREILIRLLHKAAARLRHVGYYAGSVSLSVSYLEKFRWSDGYRVEPCRDTLTLIQHFSSLWERRADGTPKKVGLVLGDLIHARNVTNSLFGNGSQLGELANAMDQANEVFGRYAVYFGGMHGKGEAVNTRIAFGVIPDTKFADC